MTHLDNVPLFQEIKINGRIWPFEKRVYIKTSYQVILIIDQCMKLSKEEQFGAAIKKNIDKTVNTLFICQNNV